MVTEKEIERWVDDSIRHAVECVAAVAEEDGLSPYRREDWGKFYKRLRGKTNVDVRLLSEILRDYVFLERRYRKDFGKPRLVLVKTAEQA